MSSSPELWKSYWLMLDSSEVKRGRRAWQRSFFLALMESDSSWCLTESLKEESSHDSDPPLVEGGAQQAWCLQAFSISRSPQGPSCVHPLAFGVN